MNQPKELKKGLNLYKTIRTWRFDSELNKIASYIAIILNNPNAANNFLNLLSKKESILQMYPYSFNSFNSYSKSKRYFLIKNYTIIYSIDEFSKTVYLERCLYSKSNLKNK